MKKIDFTFNGRLTTFNFNFVFLVIEKDVGHHDYFD